MSYCIGIDFASENVVVTVADPCIPYVPHPLRNELSQDSTPGVVAFQRNQVIVGENAQNVVSSFSSNAVRFLPFLLSIPPGFDPAELLSTAKDILNTVRPSEDGSLVFGIADDDLLKEVPLEVVMAFVLQKCMKIARENSTHPVGNDVVISVPSLFGGRELAVLQRAASLAGLSSVSFVQEPQAVAFFYGSRLFNSKGLPEDEVRTVLICDQGSHFTHLSLIRVTATDCSVLRSECRALGGHSIDLLLYDLVLKKHASLRDPAVQQNPRKVQRILSVCTKLKSVLSTIANADVLLENVVEADFIVSVSRNELQECCQPFLSQLKEMWQPLKDFLVSNSLSLHSMEFVGGGCPLVQELMMSLTELPGSFTLDGLSVVSRGAVSLLADRCSTIEKKYLFVGEIGAFLSESGVLPSAHQELFQAICDRNAFTESCLNARNQLESYIVDIQHESRTKYQAQLPSSEVDSLLSGYKNWIEENDLLSSEQYESKRSELDDYIHSHFKSYYDLKKSESELLEKQLEDAAKSRPADDDDHDDRKLPKSKRRTLVVKNKEEGNELFTGKNYEHAALRYIKALAHCEKFFDLTPEDTQDVNQLKFSLYMNLSMCYLKLSKPDKALDNVQKAILIDENNSKALFRQASCFYEKKMYKEARKALLKAQEISPEDAAIESLLTKVQLGIKKEVERERSMAKRMFG